jgi:hypothetical protein
MVLILSQAMRIERFMENSGSDFLLSNNEVVNQGQTTNKHVGNRFPVIMAE